MAKVLIHNIHCPANEVVNQPSRKDSIRILTIRNGKIAKTEEFSDKVRMTRLRGKYVLQIDSDAELDSIQTERIYEPVVQPNVTEGFSKRYGRGA